MAKAKKQTEPGLVLLDNPKTKELITANPLASEKLKTYANAFAPAMNEVNNFTEHLANLAAFGDPGKTEATVARTHRLALVKVRTAAVDVKKQLKEGLIIETRLIDGLFNIVESSAQLIEADFLAIEKFEANRIAKEKADLKNSRELMLAPFGVNTAFYDLENMDDDAFAQLFDDQKRAKAHLDREEIERAEALKKRDAEEKIRREADAKKALRINTLSALGLSYDAASKSYIGYGTTIGAGILDDDDKGFKKACDLAAKSIEKVQAAQKAERDRIEAARALQAEKDEAARVKQAAELKAANEKAAKLQAEKDAEAARLKQIEADRKAAEKAAKSAPDKDKLRVLFLTLKGIQIPEFGTDEFKLIGKVTGESLQKLREWIVAESKKLV